MITHQQKLNEHQTTFDLVMIIKIARLSISSLDTKVLPIVLITICKHYKLYVEFWDKGFYGGWLYMHPMMHIISSLSLALR